METPDHMRRTWMTAMTAAALVASCGEAPTPGAEVSPGVGRVVQAVREGGPNPAPIPLELRNNGLCAEMEFRVAAETSDGAAWLSTTPATGTIPARGNANVLVNLDVVGPMLAPGTYTGTLRVAATCRATGAVAVGSPSAVGVSLTVEGTQARLGVQDAVEADTARLESRWTVLSSMNAPRLMSDRRWGAHWTGRRVLLWNDALNTGASYDPAGDVWTQMAAQPTNIRPQAVNEARVLFANNRLYAFGGTGTNSGLVRIYDPVMNAWSASTGASGTAPQDREGAAVEWTRGRLLVWGGRVGGDQVVNTGATWDPAMNAWTALPTSGAPSSRESPCAGTTGDRVVVWGGEGAQGEAVHGGAVWEGDRGAWRAINVSATTAQAFDMARCRLLWTGTRMVAWVSRNGTRWDRTLRYFDPLTDLWTARSGSGSTTPPAMPITAWTGNRVILYGAGEGIEVVNPRTDETAITATGTSPTSTSGVGAGVWIGTSLVAIVQATESFTMVRRFD